MLGAAGGVGVTAIELGKMWGAHVIAAASSDEKLELCKRLGADELINYTTHDLRTELKKIKGGVDVVYGSVGDKYSEPCVRSMAWGGRYLVIGFAAGEIPAIRSNLILNTGSSAVGCALGGFQRKFPDKMKAMQYEIIVWYQEGKVKPLVVSLALAVASPCQCVLLFSRAGSNKQALRAGTPLRSRGRTPRASRYARPQDPGQGSGGDRCFPAALPRPRRGGFWGPGGRAEIVSEGRALRPRPPGQALIRAIMLQYLFS